MNEVSIQAVKQNVGQTDSQQNVLAPSEDCGPMSPGLHAEGSLSVCLELYKRLKIPEARPFFE